MTYHHAAHGGAMHDLGGGRDLRSMAASATLHCLTGCAIGEIAGMLLGTAWGLSTGSTIAISVALAFFFGYLLSTLPLLRGGLALGTALSVVLAADTLSIATMEVVDNAVMAVVPGAMGAGLANPVFWLSMGVALAAAYAAAYPVNRWLLARGRGHALTHAHHAGNHAIGWRRWLPRLSTSALLAALIGFLLGGLVVSVESEPEGDPSPPGHAAVSAR